MAEIAADAVPAPLKEASLRTVVAASAAGTTFEWYDFFVFGSLTGVIQRTFFTGLPETAGIAAALIAEIARLGEAEALADAADEGSAVA